MNSTKTTHTPGPWNIDRNADGCLWVTDSRNNLGLARISNPTGSSEKANARLIAAAPELLRALKAQMQMRDMKKPSKLEEALSWRDNDELANRWALDAIAKADGPQ